MTHKATILITTYFSSNNIYDNCSFDTIPKSTGKKNIQITIDILLFILKNFFKIMWVILNFHKIVINQINSSLLI